jgi:hypothetical protein
VLMVEFVQKGTTVTSKVYCETLKILLRAIQNKRHGMLTSGICAHEHCWSILTGSCLAALLTALSSLRATTTSLKNQFGSQRFNKSKESVDGAKRWLSFQAENFFGTGTIWQVPQFRWWLCWDYV